MQIKKLSLAIITTIVIAIAGCNAGTTSSYGNSNANSLANASLTTSIENPVSSPTPAPAAALITQDGQIIDQNTGQVVKLKGINWFGFDNGPILHGLWSGDSIGGSFEATVLRLKALGFNAVRLPFTFSSILNKQSGYVHSWENTASTAELINNLTDPKYSIKGHDFPELTYTGQDAKNDHFSTGKSALQDYLYVINFFAKNGFYVVVDNHDTDSSLMYGSHQDWINNWQSLATSIVNGMPNSSSSRVIYDILNEPDHLGKDHTKQGDPAIGYKWDQMGPIYLATMDAINKVTNGKNLFFIEGCGQNNLPTTWGDGFVTDKNVIQKRGLSDPNLFFQQVIHKPYIQQVVISPHIYGPSVANNSTSETDFIGKTLYTRLSQSFGTLATTGYCDNGSCHKFAIAIGEFGSFFKKEVDAQHPVNDLNFFHSFANYLNNTNDAVDGQHNAIDNWFYWSYNANSSDTGGIVDDSWRTIVWKKIEYLGYGTLDDGKANDNPNGVGLVPWYK